MKDNPTMLFDEDTVVHTQVQDWSIEIVPLVEDKNKLFF